MPVHHHSPYGSPKYSSGVAINASVATLTALKALAADGPERVHGNEVLVDADQSTWYFHSTSALTGDDILVAAPAAGSGRWLRKPGKVALECAINASMADHTAILTLPTGCVFRLEYAHWRITTGFTGGTNAAIGVQSTTLSTAGDILGGATGELTATIGTAGRKTGTVGVKMDTDVEIHANLFSAGEVFYFEKIADTYAAGVGFVVLEGALIANAGA